MIGLGNPENDMLFSRDDPILEINIEFVGMIMFSPVAVRQMHKYNAK